MILPWKGFSATAVVVVFVCCVLVCETAAVETETIVPNYENTVYAKVTANIPGLSIVKVADARSLDEGDLTSTLIGVVGDEKHLVLNEPVTDFVKRSFGRMLASEEKADITRKVELNIETLWIEHRKTSLLNNHISFDALIAVFIVHEGARVPAGYLEFRKKIDITESPEEKRENLMYQGMMEIAYQLAEKLAPEKSITEEEMQPMVKPQPQPDLVGYSSEQEPIPGFAVGYMNFTESLMSDTYGGMISVQGYLGGWFKNRMGLRMELSFWGTSGTPVSVNPEWDVTSSNIKMGGMTLGGTFLYSLREEPRKSIFLPYVGAGIDGFFGAENIGATASRVTTGGTEEFSADVWGLRAAFAGHVLVGMKLRLTDKYPLVLEGRWTQSGKGSNADMKDESMVEAFNLTLYDAVKRSDFDFTGWSIQVGVEW